MKWDHYHPMTLHEDQQVCPMHIQTCSVSAVIASLLGVNYYQDDQTLEQLSQRMTTK